MRLCREAYAGSITHPGRAVAPGAAGSRRSSLGVPGVAGGLSGLSFCHYHLGVQTFPAALSSAATIIHIFSPLAQMKSFLNLPEPSRSCLPGPFHFPYSNPQTISFPFLWGLRAAHVYCMYISYLPTRPRGLWSQSKFFIYKPHDAGLGVLVF